MIHTPATRLDETWPVPEEACLDVFLPIILLREQRDLRAVFAHSVQYFAEYISPPAMVRWDRAKGLDQGGPLYNADLQRGASHCADGQPLIPHSDNPHHVFYGHRPGVLERLVAREGITHPPPPFDSIPTPPIPTSPIPTPSIPAQSTSTPSVPAPRISTPSLPTPPPQTVSTSFEESDSQSSDLSKTDIKYIPPPGMPNPRLEDLPDPWTPKEVAEWSDVASISDLASSHSASQLVAESRREVQRIATDASQVVTGLMSDVKELERVAHLQKAEIFILRSRLGLGIGESDGALMHGSFY